MVFCVVTHKSHLLGMFFVYDGACNAKMAVLIMHSFLHSKITAALVKKFCSAAIISMFVIVTGCAALNSAANEQWAAHGYLTPGPTSEPELIGVFSSVKECEAAADAWTSRQVVGNPVFAECYPVDRN